MLSAAEQEAARRAAAAFLASQHHQQQQQYHHPSMANIPPSVVIGGVDSFAPTPVALPMPIANYYSQPSATPFAAHHYTQPRGDHDAVVMQVAVEAEQDEKRAARLHALKWGRRAEADEIARRPVDTMTLSRQLQHDNAYGMSEAAARRLIEQQQQQQQQQSAMMLPPPVGTVQPSMAVGAHYAYQQPHHHPHHHHNYQAPPSQQQQQQQQQSYSSSACDIDEATTALVFATSPITNVVVRAEDLVAAMDTTAQQVWQNNVVAVIEAFLALVLGVVLVVKVKHLL